MVLPTARACLRYFRQALPLHAADESVSLMPRLLVVAPQVAAPLERMHGEHSEIEAASTQVDDERDLGVQCQPAVDRVVDAPGLVRTGEDSQW